jgi:hypothetical protein
MTYQRITFVTILTYLWVMMILLGSVVLETFMIYPNVFHTPLSHSKPRWSSWLSDLRMISFFPSVFSPGSLARGP